MIDKDKAIQILDEYLNIEYNLDPMYSISQRSNRVYNKENKYCWMIWACREEDIWKSNFDGGIGIGPYYIDKITGDLYQTGSQPLINWEEEFILFKLGQVSKLDWIPLKSSYIESLIIYFMNGNIIK